MRGALAERDYATPDRDDGRRRDLQVVERPAQGRGLGVRRRPGVWLVAFAVCLALLAVGRVTLSFAVVQKNLQTEAVLRQQRVVRADNVLLQEQIARLAATPRLRRLALDRLGLVPAQGVIYLDGGPPAEAVPDSVGEVESGSAAAAASAAAAGAP